MWLEVKEEAEKKHRRELKGWRPGGILLFPPGRVFCASLEWASPSLSLSLPFRACVAVSAGKKKRDVPQDSELRKHHEDPDSFYHFSGNVIFHWVCISNWHAYVQIKRRFIDNILSCHWEDMDFPVFPIQSFWKSCLLFDMSCTYIHSYQTHTHLKNPHTQKEILCILPCEVVRSIEKRNGGNTEKKTLCPGSCPVLVVEGIMKYATSQWWNWKG